jgi:cytochrome c oxidase subunit 1
MAAIVGGAVFVLITVLSVFFGKPVGSESRYGTATTRLLRAEPDVLPQGGPAAAGKWGFAAPGTFVFAVFFLAIFVIYYAINWKYLASVWPMS